MNFKLQESYFVPFAANMVERQVNNLAYHRQREVGKAQ
jgi:hypothetical protein